MTLTIILRSIIIYFIVLTLLRIMGKRQIGEMQPFELVITLIIADLATIPMGETALPLLHGIIPLLTLSVIHYLISLLTRKSLVARKIVNGKPIIVIGPKGIDYKALKSLNMNFNDLIESLHANGYFYLQDIMYAIIQTNGKLSVLGKSEGMPATPKDLNIQVQESTLPIIIVSEGKLQQNNVDLAKIDESFITQNITKYGFKNIKELILVTLSQDGTMYVQPKNGNYKTINTKYKGDSNW